MKEVHTLKESRRNITEPKHIFSKLKRLGVDYAQENFIVVFLNARNHLITSEVVFKGGLTECSIDPRTIFRKALAHNANSILVAHNHPSGDLAPSQEDEKIHKTLKAAGTLIGIPVLDSIIFDRTKFYSMNNK